MGTQKNRLIETFLFSTQNITLILLSSEGSYESEHGHIFARTLTALKRDGNGLPFNMSKKYNSLSPYLKHELFSCVHKRQEAMLGGPGHPPRKFYEKNGAIWCILGHILAFKNLLFFG